jgi:hypothetical protein
MCCASSKADGLRQMERDGVVLLKWVDRKEALTSLG